MPINDDDAAAHGGGGPISAMLKWNWKYRLMLFGLKFRSLYFWVVLIAAAWAIGKFA